MWMQRRLGVLGQGPGHEQRHTPGRYDILRNSGKSARLELHHSKGGRAARDKTTSLGPSSAPPSTPGFSTALWSFTT